ncbi:CAP domain-containing protein [Candidatus Kaiserbacteria bacterium]|uniref:CAP domain-containing protein n=1 Tax=candidate division WWE3 bacterium TaxID=2053526 RepID=A0A955LVU3_UNCKA|nr:CAP domain-containing protein [Candidatus Kaiserbacteria bacterium]MCA9397592.1 CAP domain-containing protein [candidate division WWE3 bacterium]
MQTSSHGFNKLQKVSMSLMAILVFITFIGSNLHAILWQSSDWLISTVLPAVVVDLTNEERDDNAKAPLVRNSVLDQAAQMKAEHMAKEGYFSHYSPDGVSPWYWFNEAGYVYAHAGENLAVHFTDSAEVVEAWMKSPTHRQNIVNGVYTEIGVGTAKGKYEGYNTVFVVQLFGTPAVKPVIESTVSVPEIEPEPDQVKSVADQIELASAAINDLQTQLRQSMEPEPEPAAVLALESSKEPEEVAVIVDKEAQVTEALSNQIEEFVETPEVIEINHESIKDVVVIESPVIATSSGLAVAQISHPEPTHAGQTLLSAATQPNSLLQMVYATLSLIVISLLAASIVMETRRYRFEQVAYSLLLLFGMGGLLFVHQFLTYGAVIA